MNILHVVNIYFVLPYFIGDQFKYFKERGYHMNVVCSPSDFSYVKIFIDVVLSLIGKMDLLVAMRRRKQLPNGILLTDDDLIKAISSVNY